MGPRPGGASRTSQSSRRWPRYWPATTRYSRQHLATLRDTEPEPGSYSGTLTSLRARVRCLVLLLVRVRFGLRRGLGVHVHLVAAGVLGLVQRHVGRGEELEQVPAVLAEECDPDGDGDLDPGVGGGHAHPARAGPQPLRDAAGVSEVGPRQQDGELLAAEPADHV